MRKSPIRHGVRSHITHTKKGRVTQVRNYVRGQGVTSKTYVQKRVLPSDKLSRAKRALIPYIQKHPEGLSYDLADEVRKAKSLDRLGTLFTNEDDENLWRIMSKATGTSYED